MKGDEGAVLRNESAKWTINLKQAATCVNDSSFIYFMSNTCKY